MDQHVTRRDFLRVASGAMLAGTSLMAGWGTTLGAPKPVVAGTSNARSRVVIVRDEKALDKDGKPRAKAMAEMLDAGVASLLQERDVKKAWSQLVQPEDIVGIKTNVWRFLRTPLSLEEAITARLIGAGVTPESIAIGDRDVLKNPLFELSSALINVRPSRTHHWAGVGSLIKNYVMFSPEPWTYHDDSCADLAALWDLPTVRGKTRLNILVMLTPLFQGKGPHHFQKKYTWGYNGLILGTDPVAVDATGVRILEAKRKEFFGKEQPFATPAKHVWVAQEKFGLGNADASRIDLVHVGWEKNRLI